ncbi:sugar kinase [Rheinheimera sp. UJ63]|nr:sugar kinase [Rheinheimera sp. UJ63]
MIECTQLNNGQYKAGFGGDTLNTAVYLSRCGGHGDYFTALGDDTFSLNMMESWKQEGVGISNVKIIPGQLPGIYLIENDCFGERHFYHWRQNAPARQLLSAFPEIFDDLRKYSIIFLTGISLSIYPQQDRIQLFSFLSEFRRKGGTVAFDNNFRPKNWPDVDTAKACYEKMMSLTDIALLSFDDEIEMHGEHTIEECLERWSSRFVSEIIIKQGSKESLIYKDGEVVTVPVDHIVVPVDTTAAGDSFNGAYFAARQRGESIKQCVKEAQLCASIVIQHKGAIIDHSINLRGAKL